MPKFIMTYHMGANPPSSEDAKANQAAWGEWMAANKDALLEPQNPIGKTWTVDSDGAREGAKAPIMGYTIFQAADLEAALNLAKGCPFTEMGSLEVSQIMEMGGAS